MYKLALFFSMFFALNANAEINNHTNSLEIDSEKFELEKTLFVKTENAASEDFNINSIEVVELEEDVEFNFNPKDYLPKNFNALKGKHDLDWNTIELVELEENVELNFNPKDHLPENFNALKGKYDLDWNTIELVEIDEEVELNFETKDYLPNNFDPNEGMHSTKAVVCLY